MRTRTKKYLHDRLKAVVLFFAFFMPALLFGQRFTIISDIHGATVATNEVSQLVKSWNPEFIICCGDNNYACNMNIDNQVGQYYCEFISPYTGLFGLGDTVNRYFPAIGNHDTDCTGISNFLSYFTLPGNERYYDFVKGDVHFFCLNSNYDEPDGVMETSVQALWLENGLANSASKYNLVYFHHPAFSSTTMHGSTTYMQWPFKQWGATAVFSGHDHIYERLLIGDLFYVTCGIGGGSLYSVNTPVSGSQFHCTSYHGALLAEATNDSLQINFITTGDSLIDYFAVKSVQTGKSENTAMSNHENIAIYPNPARQIVNVNVKNSTQPVKIILYDLCGRMVLKKEYDCFDNNFNMEFDISSLKNGLYFLHLTDQRIAHSEKLLINKE